MPNQNPLDILLNSQVKVKFEDVLKMKREENKGTGKPKKPRIVSIDLDEEV